MNHVRTVSFCFGGTKIVVPRLLCDRVVQLVHKGHLGIVQTKHWLRGKVWWPRMDKDIEKFCRVTSGYKPPELMSHIFPPSAPWQDCGADLLGLLPTGESLIVVIDYYSGFLEVAIMKSKTSVRVIEPLAPMFARFSFPFSLRTDNGPQFVFEEYQAPEDNTIVASRQWKGGMPKVVHKRGSEVTLRNKKEHCICEEVQWAQRCIQWQQRPSGISILKWMSWTSFSFSLSCV